MAEREGLRERSGRQADGVLDRHSRFGGRTGKERFARLELGGPLHRAFSIDVLACPQCGGRLRLIATLHDPAVIRKFLAHLGMARQGRVLVPPHPSLAALAPDPILEGAVGAVVPPPRRVTPADAAGGRPICSLTALVCAHSVRLTVGRARLARPEAHVPCACGSSGGSAAGGQRLSMR
jgi:hypothetical protein